ncbi:tetratricopeptide repeat protein [Mangrovibacterium diazotrophicum]|uniref:Tetratricopeptide repeat protein n=1 Tax=Mangrovibacterium diazotrophicum TaxID=1261403 RepID=A0A419W4S5_9BACT|nr:tetratricopeptide repeat protein [Mangrovibacterium diazotrophicum]RKD90453.1 tetratricopeptide repeat protein [Mangrovibacterium diazotrophicum]
MKTGSSITKGLVFLFSLLISANIAFAQEVQKLNVTYTPSENGYELQIPFAWEFINCYGEIHVTITKNTKSITSSAYISDGVRYTAADLGAEAFSKPECGYTDLSADVYCGAYKLGRIKMTNVIDWLGGCFGQTYYVTEMLGVKDADYRDRLAELSLSNLRIEQLSSDSPDIEGKIKEIEKKKAVSSKLADADRAFSGGNYEEAQSLYQEALKIDSSNAHARERLAETKEKLKAQQLDNEYKNQLKAGEDLEKKGDYEGAKSAYLKALQAKPGDEAAQKKLAQIQEKLNKEEAARETNAAAKSAAADRKHSGSMWGQNYNSDSYGSATQAANLIGNFRVDYSLSTAGGEPVHQFRFYWEWDNALNTGYPQWVSVLSDTVVMIRDIQKYPDLFDRWNHIKPLYIEVESKILYYKNEGQYVAQAGKIHIVPEVIGYSGQEVDWSLPGSCAWDELFPYCNDLKWDYFRKIGLYEEIHAYQEKFGTDIAWPKYTFEYSDDINFYQGHKWFDSQFKQLNRSDYENYSTSADIVKVIWPVEDIQAIIRDFEEREKRAKEAKMTSDDFWSTPESEKKTEQSDFWDTPENATTKSDVAAKRQRQQEDQILSNWAGIIQQQREKYEGLKKPIAVLSSKTVATPNYKLKGKISKSFKNKIVRISGEKIETTYASIKDDGSFDSDLKLKTGANKLTLDLLETEKSINALKSQALDVTFTPSLDGEGVVSKRETKITVYDENSVQDDYYDLYINGEFVDYIHNSPGGKTTVNYTLDEGDNYIELRLSREMGKSTALVIIINDGEFKKAFSGTHDHRYIISAPYSE